LASRESARRFQFLREIASGGFGSVYLAKVMHPDGFSRLAAVKLLHRRWTENEEVTRRMRDEARLLGWLRHRNIVDVVDLTSIDGRAAIVMEFLEAVDLKVIVRAATVSGDYVPPGAALEVAAYCASALDAAYNRPPYAGEKPLRVIHRDIKPSNIMVDETGLVKVLDFGVARAEFDTRESETRELQFGSVDYMPPERLFFEPDTPAADVYSLGSTLFEILVLEKLGKAKMSLSKHTSFIEERLAYMRSCLGVSPQEASMLEDLLRNCLAFEPEHRPSGSDMTTHCRSLSRVMQGPKLNEWAETAIPPLIAAAREAPRKPNPLTDSVLTEDSLAFGRDQAAKAAAKTAAAEAPAPAPAPTSIPVVIPVSIPGEEPVRRDPPPGWNQAPSHAPQPIHIPISEPEDVPTVRLSAADVEEQLAKASLATLKPIERTPKPSGSPSLDLGPSDPWAVGGPRLVSLPMVGGIDAEDEWADLPTRVDQSPLSPLGTPEEDEIPATVIGSGPPPALDAQGLKDAETVLLPDAINIDALEGLDDFPPMASALSGDDTRLLPIEQSGGGVQSYSEPSLFGDSGGQNDIITPGDADFDMDDIPPDDISPGPFSAGGLGGPPPAASPIPAAISPIGGGDDTAVFRPGEDPDMMEAPTAYMPYAPEPEPAPAPAPAPVPIASGPTPPPQLGAPKPMVFDPSPQPSNLPPVNDFGGPQSPGVFDPSRGAPPPPRGPSLSPSTPTSDLVFDPPPPPTPNDGKEKSGGGLVRVLALFAGLVLVVGLAGGGFFAYKTFFADKGETVTPPVPTEQNDPPPDEQPVEQDPPPDEQPGEQDPPPDEQPVEQDPPPDEQPVEAAGGVTFISKAPNTKKLQVNCSDGSAKGETQVVIDSTAAGKCRVTAILEDRSRLTAVVDVTGGGTFSCFENGGSACVQ